MYSIIGIDPGHFRCRLEMGPMSESILLFENFLRRYSRMVAVV